MSKSRKETATADILKKKYNKLLHGHLAFFDEHNFEESLDRFVLYLQYLRDMAVLAVDEPEKSLKANSLHAAILEYEQYLFAKTQYNALKEDNEDTTKAKEEIKHHLLQFCELLLGGAKVWFS